MFGSHMPISVLVRSRVHFDVSIKFLPSRAFFYYFCSCLLLRSYFKQIDDYQLNQSIPMTTDFIIANADRVEALGVEGEVFWKPVSGLTVQASAGWNLQAEDALNQRPMEASAMKLCSRDNEICTSSGDRLTCEGQSELCSKLLIPHLV